MSNLNKGIIILWPKHKNIINTIMNELNIYDYKILTKNYITVNKNYITNFLREIHHGKNWWVQNLTTEVDKRLAPDDNQPLEYLIVEKPDIHLEFKGLKKYIREKYSLDKSYFHLCDPDCSRHIGLNCNCSTDPLEFKNEFEKHVHMLTNKNSIHFLMNSKYHPEYNFYKYFNKYRFILMANHQNSENFCIDNGGILAAYGIRDTHDLDYLTITTIQINDRYIGCENKNHKLEYERLGYTINDIINNENNYFYHFGMKFMSLEILKKFKYNRTHTIGTGHTEIREKDVTDYNLIKNLFQEANYH
jgi:hypothetical protein